MLYGVVGLGVFAGFAANVFGYIAKENLGSYFVCVCLHLSAFSAQALAFAVGLQPFPGLCTLCAAVFLFIGYAVLALSHEDQEELLNLPLIGKPEPDQVKAVELEKSILKIEPGDDQP